MKKRNYIILVVLISFFSFFYFTGLIISAKTPEWSPVRTIFQQNSKRIESFSYSIPENSKVLFATPKDYSQSAHPTCNIYLKELQNESITEEKNISNSIYDSKNPVMISDNNGITHLIWGVRSDSFNRDWIDNSMDIYYAFCSSGQWSQPESIFHQDMDIKNNAFINGKLEVDKNNNLYLIWHLQDSSINKLYVKIRRNSVWGPARQAHLNSELVTLFAPYSNYSYDYVIDNNNRIHLIYYSKISVDYGACYSFSDDAGETWSTPKIIQKWQLGLIQGNFKITIDQNKTIHVLLITNRYDVFHTYSSDGVTWSASKSILHTITEYLLYLDCVTDKMNVTHLLVSWNNMPGYMTGKFPKTLYMSWNGSSWSVPDTVIRDIVPPFILRLDNSNFLHLCGKDTTGLIAYTHTKDPVFLAIEKNSENNPEQYFLSQNYPNPFNPLTVISYIVGSHRDATVQLIVYDVSGRKVKTLVDENKPAGCYSVNFDAGNLPSGTYYYQLKTKNFSATRRMLILK